MSPNSQANVPPADATETLSRIADEAGIRRIHVLAWRELADAEAGGSEVHAHEVMRRWAEAGLEVTIRTSFAPGLPQHDSRDGYRIVRRGGRYGVFPRAAVAAATGRMGPRDALVEIWNGVPFLSPVWCRQPRVTLVHHVHGPMWQMALGPVFGRAGEVMERRIAPLFYRGTKILTLSTSSKHELVDDLGFREDRVDIIPPGIHHRFGHGASKSPTPLVVSIGRLVPVKRIDALIRSVAPLKSKHPDLQVVIVGDGYEREALEAEIAKLRATDWISLPGRLDDDAVVELLQRAWLVTSFSAVEGWGMTLTEAAACGTPSVATRTTGHLDAVVDGSTGILAEDDAGVAAGIDALLSDDLRRSTMADAAREWAERFTWDATATSILSALADEAVRRRG